MICDNATRKNHSLICNNKKSDNYKNDCIDSRCPNKKNKYLEDLADILRKHKAYILSDYIKDKYLR